MAHVNPIFRIWVPQTSLSCLGHPKVRRVELTWAARRIKNNLDQIKRIAHRSPSTAIAARSYFRTRLGRPRPQARAESIL